MKNKNLTKASKLKKREWIAQLNNQEPSKQTCTYLKEQSTLKNIFNSESRERKTSEIKFEK